MALNTHAKVAIGWGIIVVVGIGSFALAKKSVDNRRYDSMKIRERMRNAPSGANYPDKS